MNRPKPSRILWVFLALLSCKTSTTPAALHIGTLEIECLKREAEVPLPVVRSLRDVRAYDGHQVRVLGRYATTDKGHWGAVVELEDGTQVFVAHGDAVEGSVFSGVAVEGFIHLAPTANTSEVAFTPFLTVKHSGPSDAPADFPDMPSVLRLRSTCP